MNKSLKEKLLFITGGILAIFGLIFIQQKFPTSLDGSKFLAQVPGENTYEECISNSSQIIQNGNFEQIINNIYPWYFIYTLSNPKQVCFFEGISNYVFIDDEIESKVLSLYYVRHVFDGNPQNYLFNSNQSYGVFQYLGDLNQGEYTISFNAKTVVGTMAGNIPTENTLRLYIGFSDTLISRPYPFTYSPTCIFESNNLDSNIVHWTKPGMFEECTLSQFDSYDFIDITSEDYETYSKTIEVSSSGPKYIYFFPFGEDSIWTVPEWTDIKPSGSIYIDDISLDFASFTCGVTFSGEGQLFYNNLEGTYVPYLGGNLNIEDIGNIAPISTETDIESFYLYSPVPGYLHVQAPEGIEYEIQDILDLFSIAGGEVTSATVFSGGNFWIEYECFESCENVPEDFNQDGIVDSLDVEFFMNFFGQSCSNLETCQFDFDGDGIITVQDLMILLGSVGGQCGLPLSTDIPPQEDGQDSDSGQNDFYQLNGNFVKPLKIPGLEKTYNYIVNTKILNTKQSSLQIQNFFPSNMILRGLYSSTKNISLVSKEGIVRFFNLGKTTSVKSYLYLEASEETCRAISKNKKAYEEVVSYGVCK